MPPTATKWSSTTDLASRLTRMNRQHVIQAVMTCVKKLAIAKIPKKIPQK